MSSLWRVARVDVHRLTPEQRAEVCAWVGSLGVDVNQLTPRLAVSQDDTDRSYRLHLSRYVLDEHGRKQVDHAEQRVHSAPLVIPVDADSWPQWLPQAGHEQATTPEQDGAD